MEKCDAVTSEFNCKNLDAELAEAFDIEGRQGAVIANVLADTPAQKAGLQAGDVIVSRERPAGTQRQ